MRSIKRAPVWLTVLVVFLFSFVPASAFSAMTSDEKAIALNELSILQGDGSGDFYLDKQLSRSQASVFIVRLMGKDAYVSQNKDIYKSTKFTDVPAGSVYAPYIGYCVEQKIISGYSSVKFGPTDNISEKAFLKMVLGVLGYKANIDFDYDDTFKTAYSVGLVEDSSYQDKSGDNTNYLRRNVVDVLYNALNIEIKGANATIIQNLISSGIISKELAESAGVIKDSVATSITQVTALSANRVSIKFNEAVQSIDASSIQIYESGNASAKLNVTVESQGADEIILNTSGQVPDKKYTVAILTVRDQAGNITGSLSGEFSGYRPAVLKTDTFRISRIEPVSKNIVNIYFTQPININCENPSYYNIYQGGGLFVKGGTQTLTTKLLSNVNNGISLYLKGDAFSSGVSYDMNVSGDLTSLYGVRLGDGAGDSIKFDGKDTSGSDITISDASPLSENVVRVEFSQPVDPGYAGKFINYTISSATGDSIVVYKAVMSGVGDKKGKVVLLYLQNSLKKAMSYLLTVDTVMDMYRQKTYDGLKFWLSGTYPDRTNLSIVSVTEIDAGTIAVNFDRQLDPTSAVTCTNYTISGLTSDNYYVGSPAKALYDPESNPTVVKLFLPANKLLAPLANYKIRVETEMKDYLGAKPLLYPEWVFKTTDSMTSKPVMSEAVIISKDALRVGFNKDISRNITNISESNYTLKYNDGGTTLKKVPLSVSYINGTTIILRFDSLDPAVKYTLEFESLTDYSEANTRTSQDGLNSIAVSLGK